MGAEGDERISEASTHLPLCSGLDLSQREMSELMTVAYLNIELILPHANLWNLTHIIWSPVFFNQCSG